MNADSPIRYYLGLARRRMWVLIAAVLLCTAGAWIWSALQTPIYESSARILINQASGGELVDLAASTNSVFSERIATNELQLLLSELVETEAEQRLGYDAIVVASLETRADVLVVTSYDPDPAIAQRSAQTFAEAYIDVRRDEYVDDRLATAEKLFDRIVELEDQIEAATDPDSTRRQELLRDDLLDSYDRLGIVADLGDNGRARIIDTAPLPEGPVTPRTRRNLVIGALLGLIAGVGAAVLAEAFDNRVSSLESLDAILPSVTVLGSVPVLPAGESVVTLKRPDGLESEAFRTLRAAVEFAQVDLASRHVIQVTSAAASAGKTTVAANLAVAMAKAGQRVVIIDADLRRPRVHAEFGLPQVPGLSSLIIGRATLDEVTHLLELDNGLLRAMPSGPVPPGPSELLGSLRAEKVIEALRKRVDVIIVDSPPVLPVADALVLSRLVDVTIVVANAARTNRNDLVRSVERLEQAGANILGSVLNEVKPDRNNGYGYGYGYGHADGQPASLTDRFTGKRRSRRVGEDPAPEAVRVSGDLPRFVAARSPGDPQEARERR